MALNIGVVGYSAQSFNEAKAKKLLSEAFDTVTSEHSGSPCVVSGLTSVGISELAYKEADSRGWKTVGIACKKATEYELYDVDEYELVGENWGDESGYFLSKLDVLIRVGGGSQAVAETNDAKRRRNLAVYEYEL